MTICTRLVLATAVAAALATATDTRNWTSADYDDFSKGDVKRLSISSDGRIRLAPAFHEVLDSSSVYLWSLTEDSKGNLYAGGGGPGGPGARVYMIPPEGKTRTLAQLDDLEVHALAVDRQDRLYAATAPDGKIYRISPAGKAEAFFDPKAKYIWGMVFDSHGDLFVATGDRGEIFRVNPDGKGKVFYKTSETHARSIAIDGQDNLIVGTEPGGLIVRVSPKGEGFVLYQAARREITAVAVAKDGAIYGAGVGNKERSAAVGATGAAPPAPAAPPVQTAAPNQPAPQLGPRTPAPSPAPTLGAAPPTPIAGGSEVYRIDKEGYPKKVWSHPQNIVYSISFDAEGRPLIGTGNKGRIYRVDSDLVYTELLNAPPTQVTALYAGRSGRIYAATGNVGKVYQIGPGLEKDGAIESEVFDAGMFTYWGRLSFEGPANGGQIALETRSGNLDRPQNDWSAWSPAITSTEGGRIKSPAARFLQWRARFSASPVGATPELQSVDVAYIAKNVAPEVTAIDITPSNYRFPPQPQLVVTTPPATITLPPLGRAPSRTAAATAGGDSAVAMQYAKGWIGARWSAIDDNGDTLLYTVQIKGENESEWKPLKEKLTERHHAWDSTAFPDGDYRIRVIASDSPSNPPAQALKGMLISDPFTIDNTPPSISALAASSVTNKLTIRWHAGDARSVIGKAEYSIDGGDWTLVQPTTGLSDSREEDYLLTLDRPEGPEHTIAVRVTDDYDNTAVAKAVVR